MLARPIRVLYVQRPQGGGSATGLCDMLGCLDRERFEPIVLSYRRNGYEDRFRELGAKVRVLDDEASVGPLPAPLTNTLSGLRKVRAIKQLATVVRRHWPLGRRIAEIVRQEGIDLVHNNDNPSGDRASIIGAHLAGVPQICHVRFFADYFRPVDWPLSRWVLAFIYMSTAIERQCRGAVGVPASKGRVVYDPFELDAYASAGRRREAVRTELGLTDDDIVISDIGRLVFWKGQEVFVQAIAELAREFPRIKALIVGGPGDASGGRAYEARVRHLTFDLGLSDHVIFTGFHKDIPAVLAASDVVVHSAIEPEPFGRVVVEAMAAARPVVATNAGGVPEIIEDQETGLLVPLADVRRLTEALRTLILDPTRALAIGRRAREVARERFGKERFARELTRTYHRLMERRHPDR